MENKPPIVDAEVVPGSAAPRARLGVVHLLLWMLIAALLLAYQRVLEQNSGPSSFRLYGALMAPVSAAAIGGTLVWITRRLRGVQEPVLGGHYLLLFSAAITLMMTFINSTFALWNRWGSTSAEVMFSVYAGCQLIETLLTLLLAILCYRKVPWLTFFLLLSAHNFGGALTHVMRVFAYGQRQLIGLQRLTFAAENLGHVVTVGLLVALAVCVVRDASTDRKRDWLYWAGILVWTAGALGHLTFVIALRFGE